MQHVLLPCLKFVHMLSFLFSIMLNLCLNVLEQVYDVTKFLEDHPGGDDVLLSATGI